MIARHAIVRREFGYAQLHPTVPKAMESPYRKLTEVFIQTHWASLCSVDPPQTMYYNRRFWTRNNTQGVEFMATDEIVEFLIASAGASTTNP